MDMKLFRSKNAIFYTVIAITLLLAIIFASTLTYQYKYREQRAVVETRVNTMDSFVKDLDDDIEKGVKVAGFRAVLGLTNYVLQTMSFVDDSEQRFQELFYYGTIYGNESLVMYNNTFLNWTQKMREQATRIGLDVSFAMEYFFVEQTGPWDITVTTNVSVVVEDVHDVATWKRSYSVQVDVPIDGFEDPAYAVKTSNALTKTINRTIYENIYVSGNDTENLEKHMNKTLYAEFEGAPSFMMRFEGDFSPNEYGIESLVNKVEVSDYWPCPAGTSNADSLYWQCNSNVSTWHVSGMHSSFYLDNQSYGGEGRLEKYEVGELV